MGRPTGWLPCRVVRVALTLAVMLAPWPLRAQPQPAERVTFDEAVARAIEQNPSAAIAAAGILRADALLAQVRSSNLLQIGASAATTTLNTGVEFEGTTVTPRNSVTAGLDIRMPIYAPVGWARRAQAEQGIAILADRPVGFVAGERHRDAAEGKGGPARAGPDPAPDQVHRRRADEAGDEQIDRLVVDPQRLVELLADPDAQGDALYEVDMAVPPSYIRCVEDFVTIISAVASRYLTEHQRYFLAERLAWAAYPKYRFSDYGSLHLEDREFIEVYKETAHPGTWHSLDRKYLVNEMLKFVERLPGDFVELLVFDAAGNLFASGFFTSPAAAGRAPRSG